VSPGTHAADAGVEVLLVEDLGKTYRQGAEVLEVLDAVAFSARAGASVAITGPSGSGKSTLLGLVAGLDTPTRGRVVVAGQDLALLGASALAAFRGARMGFVFQSYRLLPSLTALENVALPLELARDASARERAHAALAEVGLAARARHLPARLSGGEQQRVAVARAIVHAPALILADEPTGNLDSRTGAQIADLLFGLVERHRATLLLVTHEASLASRCARVIRLEDGRIAP
jgi:putative ABC transport system ATP-binding protein